MEDLITIAIIVVGVGLKIYGALKKRAPEPEDVPDNASWEDFLEEVEKVPELRESVESDLATKRALDAARVARQQQAAALAQAQADKDAAILEAQQRYAAMAEEAARQNRERGENVMPENSEESQSVRQRTDWAALIRCNAAEAVVIHEILSKPPALR